MKIKNDLILALSFSQPLAFTTNIVIDNAFITACMSSVVSILSVYFYHKFKK
jgi:hypothetical protein